MKTKNYYNLLSPKKAEQFIRDLWFTLGYELFFIENINKHSFNNIYELAKVMREMTYSLGYKLSSNNDKNYYLIDPITEISEPYSIEAKIIIKAEDSNERDFLIGVLGHMTMILNYPYPDYQSMYYEIEYDNNEQMVLDKEITQEEYESNHELIDSSSVELDNFVSSLNKVEIDELQNMFNKLENKESFKPLIDLIKIINNIPLTTFVYSSEEVEFTQLMRIEYDFHNFLTQTHVAIIDESYNNEGLNKPCIITRLGTPQRDEVPDFIPYLELLNELDKRINEFT